MVVKKETTATTCGEICSRHFHGTAPHSRTAEISRCPKSGPYAACIELEAHPGHNELLVCFAVDARLRSNGQQTWSQWQQKKWTWRLSGRGGTRSRPSRAERADRMTTATRIIERHAAVGARCARNGAQGERVPTSRLAAAAAS
jgi:hypothetical protein